MSSAIALLVALGALVAGVILGWILASRSTASLTAERDQARGDGESWRLKFNEAIVNLAAEAEKTKRLNALESQLTAEREAAAALRADVASLRSREEEREKSFEKQIATLKDAKDSLSSQFQEIAGKLLGDARKSFLEQAGERFTQTVTPVEALLKSYQEKLQTIEKERVDHYAGLREAVELVRTGQGQVRDETRNLVNALRSAPKTRGRWGEESLKNVLEQAGLSPYCDYRAEVSVETDEGRLRPDVVVRLPGGGQIVIDAKCSLNSYLDSCDEADEPTRILHLKAHLNSVKTHVQKLAAKSYWEQFGSTADFVVMYIPGEHFLTAALEQDARDKNDPALWDWARERRVLLATPTNLLVIARLAATYWRQDQQTKEAAEIAKLGKELHSRLSTMAEHVSSVGANLARANNAYNKMVGSLETQVLTQARRFEDHGAGSQKDIAEPPMIEVSPRPLTKLGSRSNDDSGQLAAE